jgi:hypothetical protein
MTSKEKPIQITFIYSPDQQKKIDNMKTFLTYLYRNQLDDIILHTKEVDNSMTDSAIDLNTGAKNVKYYELKAALRDYDSILNGIMLLDRQTDSMNINNKEKMKFYNKVVEKYKTQGYYDMMKTKLGLNENDVKLYLPLLRILLHIYNSKTWYDKENLDEVIDETLTDYMEWNKSQNSDYNQYVGFKGGKRKYKRTIIKKTKRNRRKSKKSKRKVKNTRKR